MSDPKPGDECNRCGGSGEVYGEVFEYEWSECPYYDARLGLMCDEGVIRESH